MRLSLTKRADYAIRAVLALARAPDGERLSVRRLAADQGIPAAFLPQVMADLVTGRLVAGSLGRSGGYRLVRRPADLSLLDPSVTEKVLTRVRQIAAGEVHDELAGLTPQERKILLLVAEGMTNKEIAAEVFLSDKTVKNYVSSILSKLNLERRAQAAAFVAKHRLGSSG